MPDDVTYHTLNPDGPRAILSYAQQPFRLTRLQWRTGEAARRVRGATVANTAELKKFALLGISQGCAFSIRYPIENPERVTCLVLLGGYNRGRLKRPDPDRKKLYEALTTMIHDGWRSSNPVFRHFFSSTLIPDAPEVDVSFDELQRIATSPQNALRLWHMNAQIDVTETGSSPYPHPCSLRWKPGFHPLLIGGNRVLYLGLLAAKGD
jgi:pimeloyl-ACP methyl ester carboxylesterase